MHFHIPPNRNAARTSNDEPTIQAEAGGNFDTRTKQSAPQAKACASGDRHYDVGRTVGMPKCYQYLAGNRQVASANRSRTRGLSVESFARHSYVLLPRNGALECRYPR